MDIYEVIQRGLLAGVMAGTITPEQARLASIWLDVQEAFNAKQV